MKTMELHGIVETKCCICDFIDALVDVVDSLDLGAIYASYDEKDGPGQSAYPPAMMLRVLLYGYCTGTRSSRKIESKTYEDVAFRYLAADLHPDHSSWAEFRKRHLPALAGLFTQALQLCAQAGLVKLGHVALDGTNPRNFPMSLASNTIIVAPETPAGKTAQLAVICSCAAVGTGGQLPTVTFAKPGSSKRGKQIVVTFCA
jgi:transposase